MAGSEAEFENMIRIDYSGIINSNLNSYGWSVEKITSNQELINQAYLTLLKMREEGQLDFSKLLKDMLRLAPAIIEYAENTAWKFENFVLMGIGGSALGPAAVHQALNPYYYNELSEKQREGKPRFYIIDNIDPIRFKNFLEIIRPEKTLFNIVTKSGNTSETMSQFIIIRDILKRLCGAAFNKNIVVTTDSQKGNLLPIALDEGYQCFEIPEGIGGRFSELTPVGLLPAAVCGIDIKKLLEGAIKMDKWIRSKNNILDNPAMLKAAISHVSINEGKSISVFMPYSDSLKTMADWYAQLWAESLGKKRNRKGEEIWAGQTPVKALGVTDQHSQIQLYTEGPFDKLITFVTIENFSEDMVIPSDLNIPSEIQFLGGHTLAELIAAEQKATEYALSLANRMHLKIILPQLNESSVGQLILLLEWETALMGELLNIDAFDQPGVEEGKIGTYALMGKSGYEKRKAEIEQLTKKYILEY